MTFEGLCHINTDNIRTTVNPRLAEMFGSTTEEMIERHMYSFMPAENRLHATLLTAPTTASSGPSRSLLTTSASCGSAETASCRSLTRTTSRVLRVIGDCSSLAHSLHDPDATSLFFHGSPLSADRAGRSRRSTAIAGSFALLLAGCSSQQVADRNASYINRSD